MSPATLHGASGTEAGGEQAPLRFQPAVLSRLTGRCPGTPPRPAGAMCASRAGNVAAATGAGGIHVGQGLPCATRRSETSWSASVTTRTAWREALRSCLLPVTFATALLISSIRRTWVVTEFILFTSHARHASV